MYFNNIRVYKPIVLQSLYRIENNIIVTRHNFIEKFSENNNFLKFNITIERLQATCVKFNTLV